MLQIIYRSLKTFLVFWCLHLLRGFHLSVINLHAHWCLSLSEEFALHCLKLQFLRIELNPILSCSFKLRWPTTVTAKPKSSRQNQKAHGKSKDLTAKQKLTAKAKRSRQKQKLTAKAKGSRQKQKAHGKTKKTQEGWQAAHPYRCETLCKTFIILL